MLSWLCLNWAWVWIFRLGYALRPALMAEVAEALAPGRRPQEQGDGQGIVVVGAVELIGHEEAAQKAIGFVDSPHPEMGVPGEGEFHRHHRSHH